MTSPIKLISDAVKVIAESKDLGKEATEALDVTAKVVGEVVESVIKDLPTAKVCMDVGARTGESISSVGSVMISAVFGLFGAIYDIIKEDDEYCRRHHHRHN